MGKSKLRFILVRKSLLYSFKARLLVTSCLTYGGGGVDKHRIKETRRLVGSKRLKIDPADLARGHQGELKWHHIWRADN